MPKQNISSGIKKILNFFLHLVFAILLAASFFPIVKWYWDKRPLFGTDFFLTKTYLDYLSRYFSFRSTGWKYIWYSGNPLARDYPILIIYFILPLLKYFSQVQAIQFFMLLTTFSFGLFSYLLFFELSGSRIFSLVLSVAGYYSVGYYGSLVWGGGLPYYTTQLFLPLVLWILVLHFKKQEIGKRNRKFIILAGWLVGLSFFIHPQVPLITILPIAVLVILFWADEITAFFNLKKVLDLLAFLGIGFISGFGFIRLYLSISQGYFTFLVSKLVNRTTTNQTTVIPVGDPSNNLSYGFNQLKRIITDTNGIFPLAIVLAAGFFIIGSFLGKKISKRIVRIIPFALFLAFMYASLVLYVYRINRFQGGWYRAFWTFPLIFGSLAAVFWGAGKESLEKRRFGKALAIVFSIILSLCLAYFGFLITQKGFFFSVESSANPSSAFPKNLSLAATRKEEENLKPKLVPQWLNTNDRNHRMFSIDACVNIWWNSYYDLPLFKGYIDPPIIFVGRGYLYLADITLAKDELVQRFSYTSDEAQNIAKFIIDWSAIKYYEGGISDGRSTTTPLSSYLTDFVKNDSEVVFENIPMLADYNMPFIVNGSNTLHYYEFKDELSSEILEGNNASTMAVVGKFGATDILSRVLAVKNLGTKNLVTIIGPEKIDDWKLEDYRQFDSLFLYDYDYKNQKKSWEIIESFVREGGNLFIDTGGEVKEASSKDLPAKYSQELAKLFPITKTEKGTFGNQWQLTPGNSSLAEKATIDDFAPAELEGADWKISFAQPQDLKKEAKTILLNQGKVVMAETTYGKGTVIWSGLNLPYHIAFYNRVSERDFLVNLLERLVDINPKPKPVSVTDWISPQERKIVLPKGASGVLFREYFFEGWQAKLKAGNNQEEKVPIYHAGPAYPGYMYLAIPKEKQKEPLEVKFTFRGRVLDWIYDLLPFLGGIIILDAFIFKQKLFSASVGKIIKIIRKRVSGWWEKEESY